MGCFSLHTKTTCKATSAHIHTQTQVKPIAVTSHMTGYRRLHEHWWESFGRTHTQGDTHREKHREFRSWVQVTQVSLSCTDLHLQHTQSKTHNRSARYSGNFQLNLTWSLFSQSTSQLGSSCEQRSSSSSSDRIAASVLFQCAELYPGSIYWRVCLSLSLSLSPSLRRKDLS